MKKSMRGILVIISVFTFSFVGNAEVSATFRVIGEYGEVGVIEECHSAFALSDNTIFIAGAFGKDEVEKNDIIQRMGWGLLIDAQGEIIREYRFDNKDAQGNVRLIGGVEGDNGFLLVAEDTITRYTYLLLLMENGITRQIENFSHHYNVSIQTTFPTSRGLMVCGEAHSYGLHYPWASLIDFEGNLVWEYTGEKMAGSSTILTWTDNKQGYYLLNYNSNSANAPYTLVLLDMQGIYAEDLSIEMGTNEDRDVTIRHFFVSGDQIILSGSSRTFEPEIVNKAYVLSMDKNGTIKWQNEYANYGIIQTAIVIENGFLFSCLDTNREHSKCIFVTDIYGILQEDAIENMEHSCWPKILLRNSEGEIWLIGNFADEITGLPNVFFAKIAVDD